jgi:hypothetical protein
MRASAVAAALAAALLVACVGPLRRAAQGPPRPEALRERLAELAEAPGPPAHLVLATIAGLEPAHYGAGAGHGPPAAPTLALLAELGVAAEWVEPVAPPASYPAHATLVTGRPPREHGVVADQRLGEHGVRRERASHASLLRAPTLWQLAAERRAAVAALDWPTTEGAGLEALLPDVVPARRGERWAALAAAGASPALAARVREADEEGAALGRPGAARDALLIRLACELLAGPRPPALLLLRLTQTEAALRDAGPASAAARAALAGADADVARLLACVDDAGRLADTAFAVAGDRALHAVHTAIRPNALLAQARLLTLDGQGNVAGWSAVSRSNGGSAFVYARDAGRALEARGVLEDVARRTGLFRVVSADEMIRLGADPDAWFGLEALPGFAFADSAAPPIQVPSPARASNGRLWDDRPATPGFVAFGRGVRRGVRVPRMAQIDVAPTLAALLGFPLERVEGRALVGLLTAPAAPAASPRAAPAR